MRWDLPELTEDAFVTYLRVSLGAGLHVRAAWEVDEPQYPAVIVYAEGTEDISDVAEWHDPKALAVEIRVAAEATPEIDDTATISRTARQVSADARSRVIDVLAISDLLAQIIAQSVDGIAFSMAQLRGSMLRNVESVDGKSLLVTTLTVDVIAEPVTGS